MPIKVVDVGTSLYIKVTVTHKDHQASAAIGPTHTHVCYLEKDGKVLVNEDLQAETQSRIDISVLEDVSMKDIVLCASNLPAEIEAPSSS